MQHPDNMTRKDKLAFIAALKRGGMEIDAYKFWLTHCPRISRKAFEEAA